MPTGHKKESNVVKIQVEAKNPPRRRRARPRVRVKVKQVKAAIPKALIDNFVALQKVQTDLTIKLDALTRQISALLNLFEATAKSFAENPAVLTSERDKEFLDKINQLLEQDKAIAKGVVYIEERVDQLEKDLSGRPLPAAAPAAGYQESSTPKMLPRV